MSSFLAFSDKNTLSYRKKKFVTAVKHMVNHMNLPVLLRFSGFGKSDHSESGKYENLSDSYWYSQHYQCHIGNVSARA